MAEDSNILHRILLGLAPVAFSAFAGQALYVLVWGVKLDATVAQHFQMITEIRARLDHIDGTSRHNATRATSLEESVNSTSARLDTLIALMRVRERSDNDYQRPHEDRGARPYRLQSADENNPSSSPP